MRLEDFDYELPPERIAQRPAEPRDAARMLVLERSTGEIRHSVVRDLPEFLRPSDLLVWNDTRVIPSRLRGRKARGGGACEVLLLEKRGEEGNADGARQEWTALLSASRSPRPGERVLLAGGVSLEVLAREAGAVRRVRLTWPAGADPDLSRIGETPLPPYIRRQTGPDAEDAARYQTIYASVPGAAAAPTAGLHFTPALVESIRGLGIGIAPVTLHVGYGTFAPVDADDLSGHRMHEERYTVPPVTARAVASALGAGRRIVAVGTTTVRALESAAIRAEEAAGDSSGIPGPAEAEGRTSLFIRPGHRFRSVSALLTNFHLPRSTLLVLVCAFAGREPVLRAYREAIARGYRFYSYGDAMLVV